MSEQGVLPGTGVPTPPGLRLSSQQRVVLELIGQRPRASEEIGASIHERRAGSGGRGHPASERCDWCRSEGSSMGSRLRELGLVRFSRKAGVWYLVDEKAPSARGAQSDDIPF